MDFRNTFKSHTLIRSMSAMLVYFLLILTLTSSQVAKVPFDDHYFEVKAHVDSSPPPPRVHDPYESQRILLEESQRYGSQNIQPTSPGSGGSARQSQLPVQYYSNGTHTLYQHGNITEYYQQNPDVYGGGKGPIFIDPNTAKKYVKSPLASATGAGSGATMDNQSVLQTGANPNLAGYPDQSVGRSIPSSTATGSNPPNFVEQTQRRQDQLARLEDVPNIPRYRGSQSFGTFSQNYVSNVGPNSNIGDPSGPYVGQRYPGSAVTEKDPFGAGRFPFGSDPVNFQPDRDRERPIIGAGGTLGIGGQQPNTGTGGGAGAGNIGYYNPGGIYVDPRQQPGSGRYDSRGVFDPGLPNQNFWNERWSTTTYRPMAPGVLGRWRDELQGMQRPEDINVVPTPVYTTTSYGRVQGFKVKLYDGPFVELPARPGIAKVDKIKATVHSFVGIPYARAPINEGRFRPPRTHPGWVLHQAVEFGPACPQPLRYFGYQDGIVQVDEDCLYLNVFSPDVGSGAEGAPYPVIFYIHDGDFIHGGSQTFPPHQLVGWYKLVVVTVNFRLGSLGFLSTADEFSPGNYGMLDLSMALKWVHTNIRSFNGDPNRINLLGLGSGAAAAGLLMLSPRTRNMVHNVIALEGAPTADWAAIWDRYRLQNTTELYALKMGCWHEYDHTSWTMVQCLRSRSWQELANLELDPDVGYFPWSPVVDREFTVPHDDFQHDWKEVDWRFLPDTPENMLRASNYPSTIKYMTGYSRQCAADLLYANKTLAPNFIVTRAWFDEQINLWIRKYNYTLNPEGVFHAIRYAYTYWPDPTNTTHMREQYIDFLSDALYGAAIDQTTKLLLARGTQVHTMVVNYTLEGLRLPFWREVSRELQYYLLSGAPFMDPEFLPERLRVDRSVWTEGDRNMSLFMLTSVANFAHLGHPTSSQILGIFWERSTPADIKYLSLNGTNNSTMDRNYRQRELTFWTEYMPFVVGKYVPTWPPTTEYWWEANQPIQVAFWSVSGICLVLLVILIICCLLWRTTKRQRDRIYDDLGLNSHGHATPLVLGHLVGGGDEVTSEYAETVKTIDSMDSGVKLSQQPRMTPSPSPMPKDVQMHIFPHPQQIHTNIGAISQPTINGSGRERDRYPIPTKRVVKEREKQVSAHTLV